MPLRDDDQLHNRLRGSAPGTPRPHLIDDFQAAGRRHFPGVGTTLAAHRPAGSTPQAASARPRRPGLRLDGFAMSPVPAVASGASVAEAALPNPGVAVPALEPPASKPLLPKRTKRGRIVTRKRILVLLLLIILAFGGWYCYRLLSNVQKVFHGSLFSVLTTTKLKGEDTGRVNILMAGNSADDPLHDGAELTDSIMVASIDVRHHTAFMISIPRDLWVDIPGFGHAKINEAYYDGQQSKFSALGYPNGGMGLLEETVYQTLGIRSNYYALVDYSALRDTVNAVGGVDFQVKSDDPRGLYDPSIDFSTHGPLVNLTNGVHHLNGAQALDLARARGDAYGSYGFARSDFDRTEHQRELLLALKAKVLSTGTFANPVTVAKLFDSVGKNVRTDFSLSEVHRLYDIGKDIKDGSIQSIGLNDVQGKNYLANYLSPVRSSALIPAAGLDNYSDIQALIKRLLSSDPIVREGARVVVLNGSDVAGVAAKAETALAAKGITVAAIGDADTSQTTSTIIDASDGSMPSTLALLRQLYGTHVSKTNPYDGRYDADFIIIIGKDKAVTAAAKP